MYTSYITYKGNKSMTTKSTAKKATVQFSATSNKEVEIAIETVKTIAKDKKIDLGSLLVDMLKAYQSNITATATPDFSDNEAVMEAIGNGHNLSELIKIGTIAQAKKLNTQASSLEALKTASNSKTTIAGSAEIRVERALNAIFTHNDSQSDKKKMWFISPSSLQKVSKSNMNTVKDFHTSKKSEIESHNAKHSLNESTNRGRKGESIDTDIKVTF